MTDKTTKARMAYLQARHRFEHDRMRYETACSNERIATNEQERAKAAAERRIYRYAMDGSAEDLRRAEWLLR